MLIAAGFLAPYLLAVAAFPLLVSCRRVPWIIPAGTCILMMTSPWLIPAESPMPRFLASVGAAMLALKFIDVSLDLGRRTEVTWRAHVEFLANPFTHVRRCLPNEHRPSMEENRARLLRASITCAASIAALVGCFKLDWSELPFLAEHVSKVTALMLAIGSGLAAAAATWRLTGGVARDFMDGPFVARTPADFWRRYNRNVQQFFSQNVFSGSRSRRAPIRTMLLVFALSAILHELVFLAAVGRVQGYQTAFFAVQGLAAAATARVKVRGWLTAPWVAGTLAFNLLSSVLFFASIDAVVPFYSQGLPTWLQGW